MRIYDLIIIYLAGVTGMWKALPVGFLLFSPPYCIAVMTCLGALTGVFLMYFFGTGIEKYFLRFYSKKSKEKKQSNGRRIFEKYGTPGLGLIGTLFLGQPVVMIVGMVVVKEKKKFLFWVSIGTVIWSIALTALGAYSIEFFESVGM